MKIVDTRGLVCPAPLIKTRQGLTEAGADEPVKIIIDNPTSLNNVKRYLTDNKLSFSIEAEAGATAVTVTGHTKVEAEVKEKAEDKVKIELKGNPEDYCTTSVTPIQGKRNTVIAITSDKMGSGDDELGARLIITFFRMLTLTEPAPDSAVFYNSGVKLTVKSSPVEEYIKDLAAKGTGIYICTTCINHFSLKDQISVGSFSDMYQIVNLLKDADHIIRP
ncbi:MAG TPA: sulfurtransferase-like selenium metabolism protein YedF [Bacteroidales bacterium]|nr:sulfurtransferase-like selenium metabolism protein YedF [Bacteroidales bacterium]